VNHKAAVAEVSETTAYTSVLCRISKWERRSRGACCENMMCQAWPLALLQYHTDRVSYSTIPSVCTSKDMK